MLPFRDFVGEESASSSKYAGNVPKSSNLAYNTSNPHAVVLRTCKFLICYKFTSVLLIALFAACLQTSESIGLNEKSNFTVGESPTVTADETIRLKRQYGYEDYGYGNYYGW